MDLYAVIVAGGSGNRMNSPTPKQFVLLNGRPVLYYAIQSFLTANAATKIILVLPEDYIAKGQEIIDAYFDHAQITITVGGRTRFHSVKNGLALVESESIVMVHDAARCLVSVELINKCISVATELGNAVPAIACRDSVRILIGEQNEVFDRNRIRLVQTPQAFHSGIILPAFDQIDYKEHFTDEATVVESFGIKIHLIEGESDNIKITYDTDLEVASRILYKQQGLTN